MAMELWMRLLMNDLVNCYPMAQHISCLVVVSVWEGGGSKWFREDDLELQCQAVLIGLLHINGIVPFRQQAMLMKSSTKQILKIAMVPF
jgi:hypothetical protein